MENKENKEKKEEKEEVKKLSYEQLQELANQLVQQNAQLRETFNRINNEVMFKRLDYLFEVLKYSEHFDMDFYKDCVNEIEKAISIKNSESDNNDNGDNKE